LAYSGQCSVFCSKQLDADESSVAITLLSKCDTIKVGGEVMASGLSVICQCACVFVQVVRPSNRGAFKWKWRLIVWLEGDSKPRSAPVQTGRVRSRMSHVPTMGQTSGRPCLAVTLCGKGIHVSKCTHNKTVSRLVDKLYLAYSVCAAFVPNILVPD
jgi:hypothetical protein